MATGGVSDTERGTDETFDFLCSVCKSKNKNTEADRFCSDCHDYYCSTCVKFHDEIPVLKSHKIVDKSQFQPGSSGKFPEVPTERCKIHAQKPLDMYCKQHDAVGCSNCMVVDHGKCTERLYVPDYINNNPKAAHSRDVTAKLDTIAKSLKELEKALSKEKETLANSKKMSSKKIREFREEINHWLDDLEKNTVLELEQRFKSLNDKIDTSLKEIKASAIDVQSAQDKLTSAGGNMSQMFVSIKMANDVASEIQQKVNTTTRQVSSKEICFTADEKIQSLFSEVRALGSISQVEELQTQLHTQTPVTIHQVKQTQAKPASYQRQQTPSLLQVKGKKQYPVKVKSDKMTCSIYSACTLPDGSIILADSENCKLKRMDSSSYTVRDYCDVPKWPWQVCTISNQEVAVSCTSDQLIQFVSVGEILKKTRTISTGILCRGLAYGNDKLFVSDAISVYVYTVSGNRLQQFSKDQTGQEIFSNIYSLAISNDSTKIYVADFDKGLTILDSNGSLVGEFNDPVLSGAHGVCLHKADSVLVCGYSSRNVLQFSTEGMLLGEVLKTDARCQAVCSSKNNSELIICFYSANEILVTKL